MWHVRVANLPTEVADRTLKMALGAYGEIQYSSWNIVKCLPLSGCQWNKSSTHDTDPAYPLAHGGSRAQNTDIIRGADENLLCFQWTGSSIHCMPVHVTGTRTDRRPRHHGRKWRRRDLWCPRQHWIGTWMRLHPKVSMQRHCMQLIALPPLGKEKGWRREDVASATETQVQEPTKDTAGDITQDGKRQKLSADHAPQPFRTFQILPRILPAKINEAIQFHYN